MALVLERPDAPGGGAGLGSSTTGFTAKDDGTRGAPMAGGGGESQAILPAATARSDAFDVELHAVDTAAKASSGRAGRAGDMSRLQGESNSARGLDVE